MTRTAGACGTCAIWISCAMRAEQGTHVEEDGSERNTVQSPEGTGGQGNDRRGSRRTNSSQLSACEAEGDRDVLVHQGEFTKRVALDTGSHLFAEQ